MCFQKKEAEGYWLPIALGKKVRVDEGHSRPTLAIVGKSAEFKKVIVLSTKHWVVSSWSGRSTMSTGIGAIDVEAEIHGPPLRQSVRRMPALLLK